MGLTAKFEGRERLRQVNGRFTREIPPTLAAVLNKAAAKAHRLMLTEIKSGAKTGEKWPSLPNRSSAPEEAPATQSNELADSLAIQRAQPSRGKPTSGVTSTAAHWRYMEFGTHDEAGEVWIAPRPFVRPAFAIVQAELADDAREAFKNAKLGIPGGRKVK